MGETLVSTVVTVEEQITQELVKANVTETIIAGLKEKYLPLQIKGLDDKETYLEVKEARKECKALRVMAEKICKKGREEAVAIQKAWVAKEKDVAGRIGEVEDHLEKQEKDYEAAVAKEKEERRRKQEEQFILRQQALTSMNALYSEGNFVLGDVSFEYSLIKEADQDIWESDILPKFQAEFQKVEAERIEVERVKKEKEDEFKRQQEEFVRKQQELAQKEAALKALQEEQERKQREEEERRVAEALAQQQSKVKGRCNELVSLGMTQKYGSAYFKYEEIIVNENYISEATDAAWVEMIEEIRPQIELKKQQVEQKRLADIEAQKEAERLKVLKRSREETIKKYVNVDPIEDLSTYTDEEWQSLLDNSIKEYEAEQKKKWEAEQEEKRRKEEEDRQLKLEQAKDKEKWQEMMEQINAIVVFDMRSSQYRKKAMMFREKLEEIKALDNGQN